MALNQFIGWSKDDLEAALRRAQEDLAAGKSIESSRAGDVSKTERYEKSIDERIGLILKALSLLDPVKYPADQITRTTQTRATFSCGEGLVYE